MFKDYRLFIYGLDGNRSSHGTRNGFAFILSFCRLIEQSRCTTIDCCGAKCDRDVYTAKDIEMLERKSKQDEIDKENKSPV